MSDDDLIRRGDAMALMQRAVDGYGQKMRGTADKKEKRDWQSMLFAAVDIDRAISALPAVTVGVPEATVHRAVLDWIRDDAGAAVKMSMTPDRANALTARILAALDLTPAPRRYMGQIMAECDCPREAECQAAGRCIAEGRKDEPRL